MAQNLIEKIAQAFAVDREPGREVRSGEYLYIRPAHVMTHDNTGAVIPKFRSIGAVRMANPRQPVFALDHNVQDRTEKNLDKYRKIEAFAREHGVDFYPAGRGIGHQIMCEEGYAWPGSMMVASDSHSNMYGGLGCLGTPIVRTDAAAIWATGRTWWQVPPVARVELTGAPGPGVTGKDVIIALCGYFNNDEVLNHAIEFSGSGIDSLTIDQRLSIANMTTEWGALAGVFPVDEVTLAWLRDRAHRIAQRGLEGVPSDEDGKGVHPRMNATRIADLEAHRPTADPDANYAALLTLDLSSISPHVSGPNTVKTMHTAADLDVQNIRIHKAYLLSCVNGRVEDLADAAAVVRGRKVAEGVQFYIAAASSEVQRESTARGDWDALLEAGARPLDPGCGPCIGLGEGLLEAGEVGISATNRNFKGRMGSADAFAYLASPAVVAASAIAGKITGPTITQKGPILATCVKPEAPVRSESATSLVQGFPTEITGNAVYCHQDNMNTDGIYPGKYTYNDDFTPEQQASVVMENYDPAFATTVQRGDVLIGGFNFGTGSSREQAATALKYRGIALVVAGSFSETYKRNAINNGFLVIEAPALVRTLLARYGMEVPTVHTACPLTVDILNSCIRFDGESFPIDPVGPAAQELILAGGLEDWVKAAIAAS